MWLNPVWKVEQMGMWGGSECTEDFKIKGGASEDFRGQRWRVVWKKFWRWWVRDQLKQVYEFNSIKSGAWHWLCSCNSKEEAYTDKAKQERKLYVSVQEYPTKRKGYFSRKRGQNGQKKKHTAKSAHQTLESLWRGAILSVHKCPILT